jgi:hypothetical protein
MCDEFTGMIAAVIVEVTKGMAPTCHSPHWSDRFVRFILRC